MLSSLSHSKTSASPELLVLTVSPTTNWVAETLSTDNVYAVLSLVTSVIIKSWTVLSTISSKKLLYVQELEPNWLLTILPISSL